MRKRPQSANVCCSGGVTATPLNAGLVVASHIQQPSATMGTSPLQPRAQLRGFESSCLGARQVHQVGG